MKPSDIKDLSADRRGKTPKGAMLISYAAAAAIMTVLCCLTRSEALVDWDSWEYASLAIVGKPSGLGLGRWWFIFFIRLAYFAGSACGLDMMHSYVAMQVAVIIMSVGAIVALMHWTWLFTGRLSAAVLAGCIGLVSPSLMVYCSTVMTETPTMLFLALAMIFWEMVLAKSVSRPAAAGIWSLAAGVAFGVAVSMREPALVFCAWPIISCFIDRPRCRWRLLAMTGAASVATLGFAVCMAWAWSGIDPITNFSNYSQYMHTERETFGFRGWLNIKYLGTHFLLAAPLAGLAFLAHVLRRTPRGKVPQTDSDRKPLFRRAKWLGIAMLPYVLATWYNPSLSFNYRLMLPLAWMAAPIAAVCAEATFAWIGQKCSLSGRMTAVAAGVIVLMVSGTIMKVAYTRFLVPCFYYSDYQKQMFEQMQTLPDNSAVFPGPGSAIGIYLQRTGLRPDWIAVPTGFGWTGDNLAQRVEGFFKQDKRVFVNLEPYGWGRMDCEPMEWMALNDMVSRFETRHAVGGFQEILPRSLSVERRKSTAE